MKYLVAALALALPAYSLSTASLAEKILRRRLAAKEMFFLPLPATKTPNPKQPSVQISDPIKLFTYYQQIRAIKKPGATYDNVSELAFRLQRAVLIETTGKSVVITIDSHSDKSSTNAQEIEGILTQHGDFTIASIEIPPHK